MSKITDFIIWLEEHGDEFPGVGVAYTYYLENVLKEEKE